jgi:hypothetical protein
LGEQFLWIHDRLLVNGFRLGFGKEFLKILVIPDRVPDGIDLQTSNRNNETGRSCDQLAKYFYSLIRPSNKIVGWFNAGPVGVGAASQPLILRGERSGLQTRIAATESAVVRAEGKVTAFLELEAAVRACTL